MGIDSLEETEDDPKVHGENVKITGKPAPDNGDSNGSESEGHDFNRRSILGSETERSRVGVVDLVDMLVERAPMERTMGPVMPSILENEEDGNLIGHLEPGRKGDAGVHSEVLAHGMEEPDLRELDGEVAEKNELGASPLLCSSGNLGLWTLSATSQRDVMMMMRWTNILNLVLSEVRDGIDDDPRQGASEVDDLVHHERHDARRERVIVYVLVPCRANTCQHQPGDWRAVGETYKLPRGARTCSGEH